MSGLEGRTVALVTYAGLPDLSADDQLLHQALSAGGALPAVVRWDADAEWGAYDAVLIRSPWDYYKRHPQFLAWLDRLEQDGARVFNPVATLRWNADKWYMRDLGRAGVHVTPTAWLTRGSSVSLTTLMTEHQWQAIVVKPTVSATAFETFRVGPTVTPEDQRRVAALLRDRDLMVQPYLPAIALEGEYSLLFFGGEFSHAVLKQPKAGDFRVQNEFGGTVASASVESWLVDQAAVALAAAPEPTLYARVDGCVVEGRFMLMELELVEPCLFFAQDPGAASRFVSALESALSPSLRTR